MRDSALDPFGRALAPLRARAGRLAWAGASLAAAGVAVLGGLGFLTVALYVELSHRLAPPAAALVVGGVLLVAAAGLLLVAALVVRRPRPAATRPGGDPAARAGGLGVVFGEDAVRWARSHPYAALGAALVAGLTVGANPGLRRDLEQLAAGLARDGAPRP